jgi:hypothetical protein
VSRWDLIFRAIAGWLIVGILSAAAFAQEASEPGYTFVAQELGRIKGQIFVLKQAISKQTSLGQGQSIALKSQLSNLDVDVKALAESLLALQTDARVMITKEMEVKARTEIEVKALIEKLTEAQVDTATRLNQLEQTNQKIILIFGGALCLLLVGLLIKIFKRSSSSSLPPTSVPSSTITPSSKSTNKSTSTSTLTSAEVQSEDTPVEAQNLNGTKDATALTPASLLADDSSTEINALIVKELQRTQQTLDQAKQGFMHPVDIL